MRKLEQELTYALDHLEKAERKLDKAPESASLRCAYANLGQAIYSTEAVLRNLRHAREEACEKS